MAKYSSDSRADPRLSADILGGPVGRHYVNSVGLASSMAAFGRLLCFGPVVRRDCGVVESEREFDEYIIAGPVQRRV